MLVQLQADISQSRDGPGDVLVKPNDGLHKNGHRTDFTRLQHRIGRPPKRCEFARLRV